VTGGRAFALPFDIESLLSLPDFPNHLHALGQVPADAQRDDGFDPRVRREVVERSAHPALGKDEAELH
jgi:hypothetical protein